MQSSAPAVIPPKAAKQAIHWLIELQARPDDPALQQAWQQWRQSAPEHERAWSRVETMNRNLQNLPTAAAQALLRQPTSRRRRQALKVLTALTLLSAGAAALYGTDQVRRLTADYSTTVGERRRLALADGSIVYLNTDTAINVALQAQERRIHLLKGEIKIQTGHDPRPMWVVASEGTLRPLGTRFTVRTLPDAIRVGVEQGRVRVRNQDGLGLDLSAGQQVDFDRRKLGTPSPLPPGNGAWKDGVLSVSGMPLKAFLAEISRYRPGRLVCAPQIENLRISGTFPLDDSDRILATLPHVLPVEVHQRTRYWVTVSPRNG